ncbi:helix-turn-helix domain-containing protein [Paenibacillus contaminans]|uniref:HTH araC/xylS-type domain-containing protein n=1 Tax=Paenibacillus contaminans TaxID=450362 RepID=A0A329MGF8_9BACL|nr:helix-turn-helix domain-containing protein [Paenibacillus contaminans]RAV18985.1 hypothetical protein DQG23_22820 [Paenibacillus contaminans]
MFDNRVANRHDTQMQIGNDVERGKILRMNWFNRLLLSYLPVFLAISLTLLSLAYLSLNEMSKRAARTANQSLSNDLMQMIDTSLSRIDDWMFSTILANDTIKRFYQPASSETREYIDLQAASFLNEMVRSQDMVQSVYLYRSFDAMVLTPNARIPIEQFGDKEFIGKHSSSLTSHRWVNRGAFAEREDGNSENVISLVKFADLANRSLIVVNVSTNKIGEILRGNSNNNLNYVEMVTADGKLIASRDEFRNDISSNGTEKPDSGKEWSHVTSDYTGWTIRSGAYKSGIIEWISSLFYVWMALGAVVIVLGIVWLVYVSRRNYRPIQHITARIAHASVERKAGIAFGARKDEFETIERAIDGLLDHSTLLQEENRQNSTYRRKHLFLDMITGDGQGERCEEELKRIGIEPEKDNLTVLIAEIDGYAEFEGGYQKRDQFLFRQVLELAVREMADKEGLRTWMEWTDGGTIAVLCAVDEECNSGQRLYAFAEMMTDWIRIHLPFTVTVSIGADVSGLERVSSSYQSAMYALQFKSSVGKDRVITLNDLASFPQGETSRHLAGIRSVCALFRAGDEEWEKAFHKLYDSLRAELYSREDLRMIFHYFVSNLHKEMMELSTELQHHWAAVHPRLKHLAEKAETAEDNYEASLRELRETFKSMRDLRDSKSGRQIIRQVRTYIGEQYGNPELSLSLIGDTFDLQPSHLSKLFKEEFGVKFIDYVTDIRMRKAKELLEKTNWPIQEIASAVGYASAITFNRVFKKETGNSPSNYRKDLA